MSNPIWLPLLGTVAILFVVISVFRPRQLRPGERRLVGHIAVSPEEKAELRRIADCAAVNAGKCPDCGASGSLCEGPSGGMSQNTACDQCLMEFNIGFGFGTGAFIVDRTGRLTRERGRVFGFSDADFAGKEVAA